MATVFNVTLGTLMSPVGEKLYKVSEIMVKGKAYNAVELLTWRPDTAQKKAIRGWLDGDHDWLGAAVDLVETGIKLSASYSSEHHTFFATATSRDSADVNVGKALSVRHSDLMRAVGALLWLAAEQPGVAWEEITHTEADDW